MFLLYVEIVGGSDDVRLLWCDVGFSLRVDSMAANLHS